MGDIFSNVVGMMLEPIRDLLYASIGRQFGYLVHCKKNVKDLEDEVNKLKVAMGSVQTRVDASLNNAEVIEDHVWRWLTDVQRSLPTLEEDNNKLRQRTQNLKCLDVCTQYRLGKEGKKKKTDVTKLIEDGKFDSIAHRRPLTRTWHRKYSVKYESFESRDLVFKEIMEALKDDQCYKIGIHGMAGVGKTRMMKEVAQLAEKDFDEIAEIVVTQNPNLKEIQQKLAEGLNLKLDKETEEARKGLLHDRLKNGKKILVMIDDVWNDKIKLEEIGIPATDDRTQGCKILLTSRRQDVCEAMAVERVFPIGVLNEAEARSLFEKKVGDSFQTHGLHSVVEAVCRECAGLPLAILAVGGALKNKCKHVWEDALEQLRNASADNIGETTKELYSHIQLSYNYLQPDDAKSLFLLCCLFPEDDVISVDDLLRFGFGMRFFRGVDTMEKARNRAHSLVTILKASSLLLEGSKEDSVKMHDVIRDVAISVASKKEDAMYIVKAGVEKWPEEDEYKGRRAISLRFKKDCVLPNDSDCPELRTLMLEGRYPPSEVPSSFFDRMVKLELLHLRTTHILTLPSSLKNLRMLGLYDCKLVNVAFLGELKKLEILIVEDYALEELATEIGQLTRLRLLDLRYCGKFKILPSGVISSLSQLEELYIPDEFDQWEVKDNASLNELNSLKRLNILQVHVPNVELLPLNDELLFKSLIRFQISIGSKFLWHEIRSSARRKLKLVGFPLKKRERELNILMEKAEMLILEKLKGLKDVFHERYGEERFQELEYLQVEDCDDEMEDLLGKPKWINSQSNQLCASGGSFSKLRELRVGNCQLMKYLFSAATARGLPQLQRLCIYNCEILEEIVGDFEHEEIVGDTIITFHQLKRMELWNLRNLRSFYGNTKKMSTRGCNTSTLAQALFNDKVIFPALEKLEIHELGSLTVIWNDPLQSVLLQLQELIIRDCEMLEEIISDDLKVMMNTVSFHQLKKINLYGLPNLRSFYVNLKKTSTTRCNTSTLMQALFNHKVVFPALEKLEIEELENFTAIWNDPLQSVLLQLQELTIRNCEMLEEIISDDQEVMMNTVSFHQLKEINLYGLPNLRSFYVNLKKTSTTRCNTSTLMQALFNHKVAFPVLEKLEIGKLGSLAAIWDDQLKSLLVKEAKDSFRRLMYMRVFQCEKLLNVVPSSMLPWLQNLEKLKVSKCDSLLYEVEVLGTVEKAYPTSAPRINVLSRLQKMELCDLPNSVMYIRLNRLCAYSNLTDLHLSNRDNLGNVFSPSITRYLIHLQKLTVKNCEKMEEIVAVEVSSKHDDDIIFFPQLKVLELGNLPKLKSICCCTRGSKKQEEETLEQKNISRVKALFNHKVAFPVLEKLEIGELGSLTAIWDDQLQSLQLNEAEDSFQRLMYLKVFQCEKLVNVIPSNMLTRLQKLEKLEVYKCDSVLYGVEVVGSVEKGYLTATTSTINVLPRLQEMDLRNLPSLVMYIRLNRPCAYSNLTDLHLSNRDSLKNAFSLSTAKYLVHLQKLKVAYCEKMEEIVAVERGQLREEDEIIVFLQLKFMELKYLPNLKSICCCTGGSNKQEKEAVDQNISRVEALFNHKVRFPALEELKIKELKSLTVIWDNQLLLGFGAQDSFRQLRLVDVESCEKLVNVISPNAIPMLQILESLKIISCDSLISGVEVAAIEEGSDEILMFPQLKKLKLEELPKLSSLCCSRRGGEQKVVEESNISQPQALFNHKVRFPALEELKIKELKSLTAIWDNQLLLGSGAQDSFRQLRFVNVEGCEKLVNVIPPNATPILQILESLEIISCDSLISGVEVVSIEEGSDEILMFPQLKKLKLEELPKLSSLCCSRRGGEQKVVEESNISQPQALFNNKVEFPMLEKLVCDGSIFEGIWLGHLGTGSISKVRVVELKKYSNIVNGCQQLPQWFEVVEEISLESCYSLEVMFNLEGVDDDIQRRAILMSHHLKHLRLSDLPELKRIWKIGPREGLFMFHNITYLTVHSCNSLRYLFSLSTARRLTQLRGLDIVSCDAMEEIVVKNEEQGEEDLIDEIVFSRLDFLVLLNLPKLTSFCWANNAVFKFPSIRMVLLSRCPELQTFASGGISTPPVIDIMGDDSMFHPAGEINKYVQQQYDGKVKGLQTVDNDEEGTSS